MQLVISDPIQNTLIFSALLAFGILFSARLRKGFEILSLDTTNNLKGLAILAVVLSHIGYFLSKDTRFLVPLSNFAGVGVDMFLFLSGYGLCVSSLKRADAPLDFYKRRLLKTFIPLWLILALFYLMDFFILHKTYPTLTIFQNFFGIFRSADIFGDLNSALWFITLIVFYYLLFPFIFIKKLPWLSAVGFLLAGLIVTRVGIPIRADLLKLYQLHTYAFPLGIFVAYIFKLAEGKFAVRWYFKLVPLIGLIATFIFGVTHSLVGSSIALEQLSCVALMLAVVGIFCLVPLDFGLLKLLGIFSFEIYLLHWPLLLRYDIFYKLMPAGLATAVYLLFFVGLAFLLQRISRYIGLKISNLIGR